MDLAIHVSLFDFWCLLDTESPLDFAIFAITAFCFLGLFGSKEETLCTALPKASGDFTNPLFPF